MHFSDLTYFLFLSYLFVYVFWGIKSYRRSSWDKSGFQIYIYAILVLSTSQVIQACVENLGHSIVLSYSYFIQKIDISWRGFFLFPHILTAMCSTFLGPILLYRPLRNKNPGLHARLGRIYVYGTLISAVIVLPLTVTNVGGTIPRIGFTLMSVLWIFFTYTGLKKILERDIAAHRRYMLRSYAMTFAFVNVNFTYNILDLYVVFGVGDFGAKVMQSFLSWIINLIIVEVYLLGTSPSGNILDKERWIGNAKDVIYRMVFFKNINKPNREERAN